MDGKVQIVPIQSVTKRKINRNATALDSQNNNLNVGDMVNVDDGSFAVKIHLNLNAFFKDNYIIFIFIESPRTNKTSLSAFCFYILSYIN